MVLDAVGNFEPPYMECVTDYLLAEVWFPGQDGFLIRAINVGGNSPIRMSDLKKRFEWLGVEGVVTYIQSGNVIFSAKEKDRD